MYTYDGSTAILTRAKNYDGVCVDVGYEAKSRYNSAALVDGANDQMRRVLSLETLHVNDSGAVTKRTDFSHRRGHLRFVPHPYRRIPYAFASICTVVRGTGNSCQRQ